MLTTTMKEGECIEQKWVEYNRTLLQIYFVFFQKHMSLTLMLLLCPRC